jgi:hypothetical protein
VLCQGEEDHDKEEENGEVTMFGIGSHCQRMEGKLVIKSERCALCFVLGVFFLSGKG